MKRSSKVSFELSDKKRALLGTLLQEKGLGDINGDRIPRSKVAGFAPLSFSQERLWFLDRLEPGTAVYNVPTAMRLTGELDQAALEQSINQIISRHEALRTAFTTVGGLPVQVVAPA